MEAMEREAGDGLDQVTANQVSTHQPKKQVTLSRKVQVDGRHLFFLSNLMF